MPVPRLRARVEREYVRDRAASVLLGQRVIPFGQQTFIKCVPQRASPDRVKVVEDAGLNACPVMNGHGSVSFELRKCIVPTAIGEREQQNVA